MSGVLTATLLDLGEWLTGGDLGCKWQCEQRRESRVETCDTFGCGEREGNGNGTASSIRA
jgi:hypothetical protein